MLGKTVRVSGHAFTLVGITEPGFRGHFVGFPMDAYVPLSTAPLVAPDLDLRDPAQGSLELLGRLRPGASLVAAEAELDVIAADHARTLSGSDRDLGVKASAYTGLDADLRGSVLGFVAVLAVVGTLVLFVACLNVAGLVLARGASRERELAVRAALGAGRSHLVRPLLVETLLLFALGGLLGAPLAPLAAHALQAFLPQFPVPLQVDVAPNPRDGLFAAGLTLLTGLVFGLVPAARAARVDCVDALKQGGRGIAPGSHRARRAFLTTQVALSLILLVGAGLFLRELQGARSLFPGFRMEGVGLLTVDVRLANRTPAVGRAFFLSWLEALRMRPGIEAASVARTLPLGFAGPTTHVRVDGLESPRPDGFSAGWNAVTPGYFETLRIPVLSGRDFDAGDTEGSERVVVLSHSTAERLFPGQEPVGRPLRRFDQTLRVVGVVGDIVTDRSGNREGLFVYLPFAQTPVSRASLVLRGPGRLPFAEARAAAATLDPDLPVLAAMSLSEHAGAALFPQRLAAAVSGAFGLFGLLLASVGLYGLSAYVVAERRHELAIRAALGARASDLRRLMLRQGLGPVAAGVALGLVGAWIFGRLAAAFLPTVGGFDGTAFAGGALLLVAVAALATHLPARRAPVTAPAAVLRAE